MIPVPSIEITAEERLRLKRHNKKFLKNLELVLTYWFDRYKRSNCEIGNLRGASTAIWEKYESKKSAMQSQLATEFSNCLHMPVETVEQYINRLNDIYARMVNQRPWRYDDEDSSNQGYLQRICCICPD